MRPLGHTTAQEPRDVALADDRLRAAWECFSQENLNYTDRSFCDAALDFLCPLRPSLGALHHLVLTTPHLDHPVGSKLGFFVSAGYALLLDRTIVYDLEDPYLHYLGSYLDDKHLVIAGTVGDYVGNRLAGALTIDGGAGHFAGSGMVGRLTNNGRVSGSIGREMVGVVINNGIAENVGHAMHGVVENNGTFVGDPRQVLARKSYALWDVPDDLRAQFLEDILHPDDHHYSPLFSHLREARRCRR